jgi:hypothetical protein
MRYTSLAIATKPLTLGKTFVSSWLNLYLLTKVFFSFLFFAKPLPLGKTTIFSWLNL